jgi:hypothetical protein
VTRDPPNNETVQQLFEDFKKAYDSVRREVLYSILIEFGVPMELVRLIKMCLNETYSKVCRGTYFCICPVPPLNTSDQSTFFQLL